MVLIIYDKDGKELFETNLKPKDLHIEFTGVIQDVTIFKVKETYDVKIDENLRDLLYAWFWGYE